jgi:hypothetical protein
MLTGETKAQRPECSERNFAVNWVERAIKALLDTESSFWREHNGKTTSY